MHYNGSGFRKRACIGDGHARSHVDQKDPRPHQHNTSSIYESTASSQRIDIPEQRGHSEKGTGVQTKSQAEPMNHVDRIRILEKTVVYLHGELNKEKKEKEYYRSKTMDLYLKLCVHEPAMMAEYRQRAFQASNPNAAPSPSAPIPSATITSDFRSRVPPSSVAVPPEFRPPVPPSSAAVPSGYRWPILPSSAAVPSSFRSPVPPSSVAVPSAPPPSALARIPAIPHQSTPCPLAVPSASRLSAPLASAAVTSVPYQAEVPEPASSHCTPGSASPMPASALYIDLTLDKTTPSMTPTSQKRKRGPEEDRQVGDNLRKKILTKTFKWMEPKDRPNFKKSNPFKPEPTSFERPLEVDPTGTEELYSDSPYDHNMAQVSQEPPLEPSRAPAHPPTLAKLPNPPKNKPSRPRKDKTNAKSPQAATRAWRRESARERMITKKKQINQEQNAIMAGNPQEQEPEDFEKTGTEMEAMLEEEGEDLEATGADLEAMLERDIEDFFGQEESN